VPAYCAVPAFNNRVRLKKYDSVKLIVVSIIEASMHEFDRTRDVNGAVRGQKIDPA
jgi:hypothetical protein